MRGNGKQRTEQVLAIAHTLKPTMTAQRDLQLSPVILSCYARLVLEAAVKDRYPQHTHIVHMLPVVRLVWQDPIYRIREENTLTGKFVQRVNTRPKECFTQEQ